MVYRGEVVKFKERPGYGFIRVIGEPDAPDIFFYHKYLIMEGYKTVAPGTIVEFELGENHLGSMAVKIAILQLPDGSKPTPTPPKAKIEDEQL